MSKTLMVTSSIQFRMKGFKIKSILSTDKTAKRDEMHLMGVEDKTRCKCMKRTAEKKIIMLKKPKSRSE